MDLILLSQAINNLRPGVGFSMDGQDLTTLKFVDDSTVSEQDIEEEYNILKTAYEATEYQRNRAVEYPPVTDYLDAVVKGDQVAIQAYIDACLAIKDKYPKA